MKKRKSEENQTEQKPLLYKDHKLPVTRRDFLATGLMGMSTMAFSSVGLLVSGSAWAQSNCAEAASFMQSSIPYLCVDCAGGMNIAGGNVLVGQTPAQKQGDFGPLVLSDFRRLGIPDEYHPSKSGMINSDFGLKFHSTSGILEGLQSVLTPRTGETKDLRKYVDGLLICAITNDDTQGNPINTAFMANKAGAAGKLVQLIGTQNSTSGGNSMAPQDQIDLTKKPSQITSFNSAKGLLSIGDRLMSGNFLNAESSRMKNFMRMISDAGKSQRDVIKRRSPAMLNEVNSYEGRQSGLNKIFDDFSPSALDPNTNPDDRQVLEDVYGKPLNTFNGQEQMSASVLNLLSLRTAGTGTISVGGGDYHTGDAVTGQNKDIEIGHYIGWAVRLAAKRNVPLFIHLFTDGGVNGDPAGRVDPNLPTRTPWLSDDGVRSAAMILVFNPNKQRQNVGNDEHSNFLLSGVTRQVGFFNPGQGNNLGAHSLVNNVNKLWIAIILNYLATRVNSNDDAKIKAMVAEHFKCTFGDLPPDWANLIRLRSLIA